MKQRSVKTTLAGIASGVGVFLLAWGANNDDDPATNANWQFVWDTILPVFTGLAVLLQGWFARDDNVSSEGTVASKNR